MLDLERLQMDIEGQAPAPLHEKLRQAILNQIVDGTLKAGEGLPSERRLREALNFSRSTIRQALGHLTQAGYLESIPSTGTFVTEPQAAAAPSSLVGLVVTGPNFQFFYPQLATAFNARLRQAGYGMLMSLYDDNVESLGTVVDELLAQNVAALAITPPRYGEVNGVVSRLHQRGLPFVFVGRRSPGMLVDTVATNNELIGQQATRHLIDLGHRDIVHLGFLDYSTGQDRARGYRQAMEEAGLSPRVVEPPMPSSVPQSAGMPAGIPTEHLADPAHRVASRLWGADAPDAPTAVFCFNDIVALGVYKALREASRRIPDDVAVVSVDNLPTVRHFEVPLTTFALPGEAIGTESAALLLRRLSGLDAVPRTYLLPANFIQRNSTAAPIAP
jgi:DNA-binding LacI/PurR family transcriptional regulator